MIGEKKLPKKKESWTGGGGEEVSSFRFRFLGGFIREGSWRC